MRRIATALLPLAAIVLLPSPANAQPQGSVLRGERHAMQTCAECHGVRRGEASPNPEAPPFAKIATTSGMTAAALTAALSTIHRAMPDLIINRADRADLIAYILSLKDD
jgi:mono/diheme cytochrome c family protein